MMKELQSFEALVEETIDLNEVMNGVFIVNADFDEVLKVPQKRQYLRD